MKFTLSDTLLKIFPSITVSHFLSISYSYCFPDFLKVTKQEKLEFLDNSNSIFDCICLNKYCMLLTCKLYDTLPY